MMEPEEAEAARDAEAPGARTGEGGGADGPDAAGAGGAASGDGGAGREEALPEPPDGEDWSLGARIAIAAGIAVVCIAVAIHLAMVFLHVAPSNTISQRNDKLIDDYVYPEFEQNWKLFAPNPLQQNIAVHARAQVLLPESRRITTGWVNLSKMDGDAIKHNIAPSHVDQNMLRRAWEFYTNSHDQKDNAFGERGRISEDYVRRIVAHRFGPTLNGGRVVKIQLRSATTSVAAPKWSKEIVNTDAVYRVLPWWTVTEGDFK